MMTIDPWQRLVRFARASAGDAALRLVVRPDGLLLRHETADRSAQVLIGWPAMLDARDPLPDALSRLRRATAGPPPPPFADPAGDDFLIR